MSTSELIALLTVLIASGTTFLVAYWHRKQMRQNEEFRRDPSKGLHPPPSRSWAFFKSQRPLLVGVGMPALFVAYNLSLTEPITRWQVLAIAVNVAAIFSTVVLYQISRIARVVERMCDMHIAQIENTGRMIGALEKTVVTAAESGDEAR